MFSHELGEEAETRLVPIPLNVLTESPDSGYLRYLILTMFLLSLPEMWPGGGEAEIGLVYIPVNTITLEDPVEYRITNSIVLSI
jgi:hypothetical protein